MGAAGSWERTGVRREARAALRGGSARRRHRKTGETYPRGTPRGDASVPREGGEGRPSASGDGARGPEQTGLLRKARGRPM